MKFSTLPALMALSVAIQSTLSAQSPAKPVIEPAAQQKLKAMRTAYDNLRTYIATVETQMSGIEGGAPQVSRARLTYQRPRKVMLRTLPTAEAEIPEPFALPISLCDGERCYFWNPRGDRLKYFRASLPSLSYGREALMQHQVAGYLFTPLLAGTDLFAPPWGHTLKSLKSAPDTNIEGTPVEVIEAQIEGSSPKEAESLTYFIGRDDHLVRRIVDSTTTEGITFTTVETHRALQVNLDLPANTFEWAAPPQTDADDIGPQMSDPRLAMGERPLPFEAKDIDGKPFRFEEYAGKVLLLDFCASWSGPCRRDLPHLQQLYQTYHAQGLEVVSVSFDTERSEFDAFRTARAMPWRHIFEPLGLQGEINKRYQIRAVPFSLLIGRDGKIAAVNSRSLLLEDAIKRELRRF
ncbi:MAG: hypothetical protein JWN98_2770 [Abditibacteriota bacterium]|nr:hypothetical protein [Abditibacteriota bacterium]